ncbi:hypothetical protein HKX48_006211 [Thoreauomyces humboldtii]|nr:hypothetical protein HKX48_006211 [Thoreauomyces humboldtii]
MRLHIAVGPALLVLASLALFFGLFFGLNYPEVLRRRDYLHLPCALTGKSIEPRFHCTTTCDNSCSAAPPGVATCSSLVSLGNALDPRTCLSGGNGTCPQTGTCNNGYRCCQECCSTCQSCTTSCSGKPQTCSTSCSYYTCNCYCCQDVGNDLCTTDCPVYYAVDQIFSYRDPRNSNRTVEARPVVTDFGPDLAGANALIVSTPINSTRTCFVNPSNLQEMRLDLGYTTWKWVVTSIFGILPIALLASYAMYRLSRVVVSRTVQAPSTARVEEEIKLSSQQLAPPPYQES